MTYIYTLIAFLLLDGAWILGIAKSFYARYLGDIIMPTANFWPIVAFYPIYVFGIYILVISPALVNGTSLGKIFLLGALFGLCAYGAYDLTNQATIKHWPTLVTVVDMLWGAFGTSTASVVGVWITRALL